MHSNIDHGTPIVELLKSIISLNVRAGKIFPIMHSFLYNFLEFKNFVQLNK